MCILDYESGTQHIFEDDDTVLYVSLHRHDNGSFFPGNDDGDLDKIGVGRGKGFNVNIPWNTNNGRRGVGDATYIAAFLEVRGLSRRTFLRTILLFFHNHLKFYVYKNKTVSYLFSLYPFPFKVVMPIATQFNPDLVLVSAGFDAAVGDPLGKCQVTPMAYARMTQFLSALAGGRLILALEGGYNLRSISECMTACAAALLGCPLPKLPDNVFRKPLHYQDRVAIERVKEQLTPFWPVLDARVLEDEEAENCVELNAKKMEEVVESAASFSVDENRNETANPDESDELADVFESLTIKTPQEEGPEEVLLTPGLKIKMAELDLKLSQVPAVVTPEVQEEAKHLIRVLLLGQEGAMVYEQAESREDIGSHVTLPSVPLVAPPPSVPSLADPGLDDSIGMVDDAAPKVPVIVQESCLEDSGILEVVSEEPEMKIEEGLFLHLKWEYLKM